MVVKQITIGILVLVVATIIYVTILSKTPVNNSKFFFKDKLNNVYAYKPTGCLDICFFRAYTNLRVKTNEFEILFYKNADSGYAKTKDDVYYKYGELLSADAKSFKALGTELGKDSEGYIIHKKRLVDYVYEEVDKNYKFNPKELTVLGYDPYDYILIKDSEHYYLVKLNPLPRSIKELSELETKEYINIR